MYNVFIIIKFFNDIFVWKNDEQRWTNKKKNEITFHAFIFKEDDEEQKQSQQKRKKKTILGLWYFFAERQLVPFSI